MGIPHPTKPAIDSPAKEEEHSADKELYYDALLRKHRCQIGLIAIWLVFGCVASMSVIWVWHLVFPNSLLWLSDQQLAKIQSLLVGGFVGLIAPLLSKKYL